jgi:type I restriction enzyme S subunit
MPAKSASDPSSATPAPVLREEGIEYGFIGNLSGEIVKSIAVGFPSSAEPQRIATCLSSLDALITAETQKLAAVMANKKGLMQQLFPSPEEVEA